VVKSIPHTPQYTSRRFCCDDLFPDGHPPGRHTYSVRAIDTAGTTAESESLTVDPGIEL
jgi:hypothetical protein